MKTYNYLYSLLLILLITSCNSDEVICNTDEPDVPQTICDTGLLIMTSDGSPGAITTFTLDSIQKPVNTPLAFNNIRTDTQQDFFGVYTNPSNYDAYNRINDTYFVEFPTEQRIYKYDIATQARQEFVVAGFYSAPVFNNGNLYAITIDNFGYASNPANFSIETINQNDGSLTTLITDSFPLISSFNWESMSSATDNLENIFFVSGTNLVSFNINATSTNHTELVPTFDAFDNNQGFYGLELRNNGNLLAIRNRNDNLVTSLELVEIDINNLTATPTVIFDFMVNNIALNSEFYSTTYDACDDMYYITSRRDATTTDFYEIDLVTSAVKTENFDFYLMGIESKNN